jgi:hypothetical protein
MQLIAAIHEWIPPQFLDPDHPQQQLHLDIRVEDIDRAELRSPNSLLAEFPRCERRGSTCSSIRGASVLPCVR